MKDSQIFNKKDSQRTLQMLTDSVSNTLSPNITDVMATGPYDYQIVVMGSGTKYQQLIRQEVLDGVNLAGGLVIDANTGSLWTYGQNDQGQLGDGTTQHRSSPVSVLGFGSSRSVVSCQHDLSNNMFALDSTGTLWTWGNGLSGSLGNGATTLASSPVSIANRQFTALATGIVPSSKGSSVGGIDTLGAAWMWGDNSLGQLGLGTTNSQSSPMAVAGNRQFAALNRNGRAIDLNNQPWSWGDNTYGQLGLGTTNQQSSPVSVVGLPATITKIVSGGVHTLFLTQSGAVYSVGQNTSGQLGDGTSISRSLPVAVSALSNLKIVDIAVGSGHSVALDQFGKVWTWGQNTNGQLGNGTTLAWFQPKISIASFVYARPAVMVTANETMGLLDTQGYAWTWSNNTFGQLGNGTTDDRSNPVSITSIRWQSIDTSVDKYSYGLDINGYAWTWGQNTQGQLGDGTTDNKSKPVSVLGGRTWLAVTSTQDGGTSASLAGLDAQGYPWMWGRSRATGWSSSPISVVNGRQFVRLIPAVAWSGPMFLALDSKSYAWGWNMDYYGNLGSGTTDNKTSTVSVLGGIQWQDIQLAGGGTNSANSRTLGLDINGYLWAWGRGAITNGPGLGDGTTFDRSSPVSVLTTNRWSKLRAGTQYILAALDMSSYAWTWGWNQDGGLGDGTTANKSTPVSVVGGLQFTDIQAGYDVGGSGGACFIGLTANGTVWTWGANGKGTLGDGTTTSKSSPVSVAGLPLISSIGFKHTPYALSSTTNSAWSWGYQGLSTMPLGDGTTFPRSSPVSVMTLITSYFQSGNPTVVSGNPSRMAIIGATDNQTSAIDTDGNCWNWGANVQTLTGSVAQLIPGPNYWGGGFGGARGGYIDSNGCGWQWGQNNNGQLGDGTTNPKSSAVSILGNRIWKQVWNANYIGAGLDTLSYAWTWGSNSGTIGDGTTFNRSSPTSVVGGRQFRQLSMGSLTAALDVNSYAWHWGYVDYYAQYSSPVSVLGGRQFSSLSVGNNNDYSSFMLGRDGNNYAWAWGTNARGEIGGNTTSSGESSPMSVFGGIQWRDLKFTRLNYDAVLGLDLNSYAWCWGDSLLGNLGNNANSPSSSPVSVVGGRQWIATAMSFSGTVIALDANSYAWTWGVGGYGEAGNNAATHNSSPVSVAGGLQFNQVGFAYDTSTTGAAVYGVTSAGVLWAWGSNGTGIVGDGTTSRGRSSPASIISGIKLATGRMNVVATDGKTVWSWGSADNGFIGDGTTTGRSSPVVVLSSFSSSSLLGLIGDNVTTNRSVPILLSGSLKAKNKRGS